MADLVVVGKSEFTLGFLLTGIKRIHNIDGRTDAEKVFRSLAADESVGVIVTDRESVSGLPADFQKRLNVSVKPILIMLSEDMGEQDHLGEMIKKSIGVDLVTR